ncbi:hypothetical protein Cantr_00936 [Candida viswanathii]|uniref:Uncharacterized protein n=1 Tax=Candida viswanathii TaxID=5486 RepID=A0A367YHA0_9ASCO|nr:hypothetical protein Cantr_00936 [Candida viswanathii]
MDKLEESVDLSQVIHALFDDFTTEPPTDAQPAKYPELILQESAQGNKLYSCFQSYNRQFINDPDSTTSSKQGDIVRWNGSSMEMLTGIILDNWINQNSTGGVSTKSTTTLKQHISRANALFIWASTDEYIEERKKELRRLRKLNNQEEKENKQDSQPEVEEETKVLTGEDIRKQELQDHMNITFPKTSINNKLNRIIEIESNKFVHLRIQRIKAHHSEQMTRQINERKRKDHELHLKKLKLKEEEYEREMMLQNQLKSSGGFLGNLFGFGGSTPSGGTTTGSVENFNNRSSNESNRTIDSTTFSTTSTKNKRFPLFGVQSLFGSSSKKNSSKVILFDQDDTPKGIESDDNNSLRDSVIEERNEDSSQPPAETRSKSATPKPSVDNLPPKSPTPAQSIETPRESIQQEAFISIDQLEKHLSKSPEQVPHNNGVSNGFHSSPLHNQQIDSVNHYQDVEDDDDDDDEFDDFTSAQPMQEPEITIFQDPPKLSRNFFSIDKAQGSPQRNQNQNDLLDIFSSSATSSKQTSPASKDGNLLDL